MPGEVLRLRILVLPVDTITLIRIDVPGRCMAGGNAIRESQVASGMPLVILSL